MIEFKNSEFPDVFSAYDKGNFLGSVKINEKGRLHFNRYQTIGSLTSLPNGYWHTGNEIFAAFHRYLAVKVIQHNKENS